MFDADTIWTCLRCFPCCLRPSSTGARDSKGTNVGHDCIGDSVAKNPFIRSACSIGTYIGSASIKSANTEVADAGGFCTGEA